MDRGTDKTTHDYATFMDDTPPRFYWSYSLGSLLILLGTGFALFTGEPSDLMICAVGALGLALLALLAFVLMRHYSRV